MRCAATRRAVYLQHREVGRQLVSGLPASVMFLIAPGHRVLYVRVKVYNYAGDWDGAYEYKADSPRWSKFMGRHAKRIGQRLARGVTTAFDEFYEGPDPYALG